MSQTLDYSPQGLPQSLSDGLLLRWAEPTDAEALADFNARLHGTPTATDEPLRHWIRDLVSTDQHPTTRAGDFLIVVDENANGKIISSMNLISQIWTYNGVPFAVGQPEAVATEPAYRRKGLVRKQFEVIHARSAVRGELVQVISGIPWYYRQFGYGMALDLSGERQLYWLNLPKLADGQTEIYRQRPATTNDIAVLARLYPFHCQQSLINRQRDEASWRYELTRNNLNSASHRRFWLVEDTNSKPVGYYEGIFRSDLNLMVVNEVAVGPGQSWRNVAEFVCRSLKAEADEWGKDGKYLISGIRFALGAAHPIYDALGRQLERQIPSYAWYVRIPDLPAFLWKIASVLEKRLAGSPMVGYTGRLRLNFYRSGLVLNFEEGRLHEIQPYKPDQPSDGDAMFPDHTFLDVLFGRRSLAEMRHVIPDCYTRNETSALLISSLFPQQPSCVLQFM